jgi:hypothetical protein
MPVLTPQQIAGVVRNAGFPPEQVTTAVAVALAESGGNTEAVNRANRNGSVDYGLFQINTVHGSLLSSGDKFDPNANARMALTVFRQAGNKWTPWSVYNSGSYRAQIPRATLGAAAPVASATVPAAPAPDPGGPPVSVAPGDVGIPAITPDDIKNTEDAVGGIGKSITDGLAAAAQSVTSSILSGIFAPGLWTRIGAYVLGAALLMFSLFRITGAGTAVKSVVKTGVGVASKGVL